MDVIKIKEDIKKTEKELEEAINKTNVLKTELENYKTEIQLKRSELYRNYEQELAKLNIAEQEYLARKTKEIEDSKNVETELDNKLFDLGDACAKDYFKGIDTMKWMSNIPTIGYQCKELWEHSVLNVDEIGNIICYLFKDNEGKEYTSKRVYSKDSWGLYPYLAIREKGNDEWENCDWLELCKIKESDDSTIIIPFPDFDDSLLSYPTDNPSIVYDNYGNVKEKNSNYNHLLHNINTDLAFCYKNHEYIKELIYSLANYQRMNNIKYMTAQETNQAFKKLYLTKGK